VHPKYTVADLQFDLALIKGIKRWRTVAKIITLIVK